MNSLLFPKVYNCNLILFIIQLIKIVEQLLKLKTWLSFDNYLNWMLYYKDWVTFPATAQLQLFDIHLLIKLSYHYYYYKYSNILSQIAIKQKSHNNPLW